MNRKKSNIMELSKSQSIKILSIRSKSTVRLSTRKSPRRRQRNRKDSLRTISISTWTLLFSKRRKKSKGRNSKSRRNWKDNNSSCESSRNSLKESNSRGKTEGTPISADKGRANKTLTTIIAASSNIVKKKDGLSQLRNLKQWPRAINLSMQMKSKWSIWIEHTQLTPTS